MVGEGSEGAGGEGKVQHGMDGFLWIAALVGWHILVSLAFGAWGDFGKPGSIFTQNEERLLCPLGHCFGCGGAEKVPAYSLSHHHRKERSILNAHRGGDLGCGTSELTGPLPAATWGGHIASERTPSRAG